MASPQFTPATPGNLLGQQPLWKNQNYALYKDYSTKLEAQVTARVTTSGAVTAASYTKHEAYVVYGSCAITGSVSAGGTSIGVNSLTGFQIGQKIIVGNELRTIASIAGAALTIDALQSAYASTTPVYLIESIASYPGTNSLGGTASTTYAKTSFLATGQYALVLTNADTANAVYIELSAATIDAFA